MTEQALFAISHRHQEIVEIFETHVHIVLLLLGDRSAGFRRIGMAGVNYRTIIKISQCVVQTVLHLLGVGTRQVDPATRIHE